MPFSFHCNDINGHLRAGNFCFAWRNGYLHDAFYHAFGECRLTIGKHSFHFYHSPWQANCLSFLQW